MIGAVVPLLFGCAGGVDRFTRRAVLDRATDIGDIRETCATGEALRHVLAAASKAPAHQALAIAEMGAGLCAEAHAREAELAVARARHNLEALGPARGAEARDALIVGQRAHAVAARRFYASFLHVESAFGPVGSACPRLRADEEIVYLVGLYSGLAAVLHDKAGANVVGVPLDLPPRVARSAGCLDDARWWHAPGALRAAAWAAVPGSGPPEVDPWKQLHDHADAGAGSGVRLAHAVWARMAANAGRADLVEAAIRSQAAALARVPAASDWALFDAYATEVSLHEADLVWTEAVGHRAPGLGALPADDAAPPPPPPGDDPFAEPS